MIVKPSCHRSAWMLQTTSPVRLVEGDELAVELACVDFAVADRHTAIGPAAADRRDAGLEVRLVGPQEVAAVDIDGENIVGGRRDVQHAVEKDRLCFGRIARAESRAVQSCSPHTLQTLDRVAVDFLQRRVAAVVPVPAVGRPVAAWGSQRRAREVRCDDLRLDADERRCREQCQNDCSGEPNVHRSSPCV